MLRLGSAPWQTPQILGRFESRPYSVSRSAPLLSATCSSRLAELELLKLFSMQRLVVPSLVIAVISVSGFAQDPHLFYAQRLMNVAEGDIGSMVTDSQGNVFLTG